MVLIPEAPCGLGDAQAVWQVALSLSSSHQTSTVLRRIVEAALTLSGGDGAALLLYDPERGYFTPTVPSVAVGLDERWLQREGLAAAQSLAQRAAAAGDVVISTTVDPDLPLLVGLRRSDSVCAIPLAAVGGLEGVVEIYCAAGRRSPYPLESLRLFGALAGRALANARAYEREQILRGRLQALDTASGAIAAELSLDQVLQRIVEVAAGIVGARYGALGVVGSDDYLTDFITTGLSEDERKRIGQLPRGHGLLGALIRLGQPLRVPDIKTDPRRVGFPPHHPPMAGLLGVPIQVRGAVVGDLYLTDKIGAPTFSEEDQRLTELLATHAGIAIENARLHAREQQARHTLQTALEVSRQQATTLRRQAELINLAHDAILVRDLGSRVVQWNRGAGETYGWTAEQAVGVETHVLLKTVFPSSREEVDHAVLMTGSWEGELRHTQHDGTEITVESRQALMRDAEGTPLAILEINRDITTRKQAEASWRFLADVSAALVASLDAQTTLTTLARRTIPYLADWCVVHILDEDGSLRRVVPALEDDGDALTTVPEVETPDVNLIDLMHSGQSLLVPEVGKAHPEFLRQRTLGSWMVVPLVAQGRPLGALSLATWASGRRYGPADLALAEAVAERAALAVTNARLYAQVGALTRQRERERIGRDLHDGIIQDIYAANLQLESAAEDVTNPLVREQIYDVADRLSDVIGDVRTYIRDLRVRELAGRSLGEGIAALVGHVDGRGDVRATFVEEGKPCQLPDARANALLHIAREALSNVIKHAQATRVEVRLAYDSAEVTIVVADDGVGFDPEAVRGEEHHGQRNLYRRAAEAGGSYGVRSGTGIGTTITVVLPVR